MRYLTLFAVVIGIYSVVSCNWGRSRQLAAPQESTIQDQGLECPDAEGCTPMERSRVEWDFDGGFEAPPWEGAEQALQRLEDLRLESFQDLYRPSDAQIYAAFSKLTRAPAATRFNNGVVAQWLTRSTFPDWNWYQTSSELVDEVKKRPNRDCTNYGFIMATSELGSYIYRNKRSLRELVTANYVMVNPCSARSLGLDPAELAFSNPKDSGSFAPVTLKSSVNPGQPYPHAGVLSDFAFLLRYPAQGANMNRSRAAFVLRDLLGIDLNEAAANAPVVEGVFDNPVMENPQCVSCHQVMDPIAQIFMGFDGLVNERAAVFRSDMFAAGYLGKAFDPAEVEPSLRGIEWLAREIASSESFARQLQRFFWTELFGLDAEHFNGESSLVFESFFADTLTQFQKADLRLDALIEATIKDQRLMQLRPSAAQGAVAEKSGFRPTSAGSLFSRLKRFIQGEGEKTALAPFETLLAQLQNDYDDGLGEPDLVNVEKKIPKLDLIYSASFARIASEMACVLAAHDVAKELEERIVFRRAEEASPSSRKISWAPWYEDLASVHVHLTGELPRPAEILRYWKLYNELSSLDLGPSPKLPETCQSFITGSLKKPSSWLGEDNVKRVSRLSGLLYFVLTDPRVIQF